MPSFQTVSAVYPQRAIIADNAIDLTTHDSITGASARRLGSARPSAASIPFAVLTLLYHSVIIVSCYSTRVIEFAMQPDFHFNGIGRRVERTVKWNELPTLSDYCTVKSDSKTVHTSCLPAIRYILRALYGHSLFLITAGESRYR